MVEDHTATVGTRLASVGCLDRRGHTARPARRLIYPRDAVVVADAPVVPLDLTVVVRVIWTPLDTRVPETPVASPGEPDGGETATQRSYGDIVFTDETEF